MNYSTSFPKKHGVKSPLNIICNLVIFCIVTFQNPIGQDSFRMVKSWRFVLEKQRKHPLVKIQAALMTSFDKEIVSEVKNSPF